MESTGVGLPQAEANDGEPAPPACAANEAQGGGERAWATLASGHSTLVEGLHELAMLDEPAAIAATAARLARELTSADGGAFFAQQGSDLACIVHDGAPGWAGLRLDVSRSAVARAIAEGEPVVGDDRRAHGLPSLTQGELEPISSFAIVPGRYAAAKPRVAVGVSWFARHTAGARDLGALAALGRAASIALDRAVARVELERRLEEATRAIAAREDFIAVAADTLQTPLTALSLQLDSLEAASARAGASRVALSHERLRNLISPARRVARTVDELLELSRVSAGEIALERGPVDLTRIVRAVLGRFGEDAADAGCELEIDVERAVVGHWDGRRLDRVVANLVRNALKFGRGRPVRVTLSTRAANAELAVTDQGAGVAADAHPRIFEPFVHGASTRQYGGLGVGLWIVRRVVEAHGGTVACASEPGAGATFYVQLPLGDGAAPAVAHADDEAVPEC